jgi:hypothetical protein
VTTPRPASIGLRVAVLGAVAAALAACGISADERVTHIPADDLGALANTTTTSTTTTTTTTTTLPPATSPPTSTPPSLPFETTTTSTIEVVELEDVVVYYVPRGRDEVVKQVTLQQVGEPTLTDVLRLLSEPPTPIRNSNLTTEVDPELVRSTSMERLYTVVDLDGETFDRMSDPNQRQAIAQLVLTLTVFVTPDRGPVGPVVFTVDGEDIQIPIPELGASEPGEPIAFRDFESWIDTTPTGEPVPVTSGPTTTPPTSSEPPTPGDSAPPG